MSVNFSTAIMELGFRLACLDLAIHDTVWYGLVNGGCDDVHIAILGKKKKEKKKKKVFPSFQALGVPTHTVGKKNEI